MVSDGDEPELLARGVAGDAAATEVLLLRYYGALADHVGPRIPAALRASLSADDLLQETFVQVFRDIGRFETRSGHSFLAWLKVMAENRLRDAIKGASRRKRGGGLTRAVAAADADGSGYGELIELVSAGCHSPSSSAGRREMARALQVAIAALPDDYREAVRLRYLEGREIDEIANRLQRTPGAVRGLLDRGKDRLREALGRASRYL